MKCKIPSAVCRICINSIFTRLKTAKLIYYSHFYALCRICSIVIYGSVEKNRTKTYYESIEGETLVSPSCVPKFSLSFASSLLL